MNNGKKSPERLEKIIKLIKAGNYAKTACMASGISEETYYRWIKEDDEFRESIKAARAEAEARNVLTIQKASETTWQAAAWWLERTHFSSWGRKELSLNADIDYSKQKAEVEEILEEVDSEANNNIE